MPEKTVEVGRFNWRLVFYGAIGALIAIIPITIHSLDLGFGELLSTFVLIPIIGLILLLVAITSIRKKSHQILSVLSMVAVYCVILWASLKNSEDVHTAGRWFLWSKQYKAEVMAQPNSENEELKHIEWDGWGFAGAGDTVVYLVFDPNNSLSAAARSHSSGKFSGIPCAVLRVHRLESHWYTVLFYTDTGWN